MPVRNSSRQHFANLKVGVKKKEKKKETYSGPFHG